MRGFFSCRERVTRLRRLRRRRFAPARRPGGMTTDRTCIQFGRILVGIRRHGLKRTALLAANLRAAVVEYVAVPGLIRAALRHVSFFHAHQLERAWHERWTCGGGGL